MGNLKDAILVLESGSREKGGALSSGIPSLGAEHLSDNGKFNLEYDKLKYVSENHFRSMKSGHIKLNDILVVKDGATTGKTSFVDDNFPFGKAAINEHVFLLRPSEILFSKYLFYYLYSDVGQRYILSDFRGATVGGISRNFIDMPIPLPSLEVQRQIADVLDRASVLIEKRKAQIEKLDLLVKSQFIEIFGDPVTNPIGWEVRKLGNVIEGTPQNGLYKPSTDYTSDGSGTPIVRIDAFYDGKLKDATHFRRLNCTDKEIALYRLDNHDIVINRVNSIEYLGKCAYIEGLCEPTVFESNMMRFKVNRNELHPLFAVKLLCSPYIYNQIISHAKKAVNQASINQKDVQDFNLYIPPLTLQNDFAAFVERVETQKALLQRSLEKLELNYKSLMQQCFRGEIF